MSLNYCYCHVDCLPGEPLPVIKIEPPICAICGKEILFLGRFLKELDDKLKLDDEFKKQQRLDMKEAVEYEHLFVNVKGIISDCVCKTVVFLDAKIPDAALNLLANEYADKIIKEINSNATNR